MARNGRRIFDGDPDDEDAELLHEDPPARVRLELMQSLASYRAAVGAGRMVDEPVEAEAGALLECELAADVHTIATIAEKWAEANKAT